MIQNSHDLDISLNGHGKDSKQLINMLRGIIAEQEMKIAELETELKKWEKKYKEEFFKEVNSREKEQLDRLKETEQMVVSYGRELEYLQNKYEGRAIDLRSNSSNMVLK